MQAVSQKDFPVSELLLQEVTLKKTAARVKKLSVRIVFPVANKNKGKEQKNRRTGILNRRTDEYRMSKCFRFVILFAHQAGCCLERRMNEGKSFYIPHSLFICPSCCRVSQRYIFNEEIIDIIRCSLRDGKHIQPEIIVLRVEKKKLVDGLQQ